ASTFVPKFQFAIARSFNIPVDNNLAVAFGGNAARARIFHSAYRTFDSRPHRTVFKSTVAVRTESAVLQYEVMGITQRLLAGDVAIHEAQVARVPAKVFAVQLGIVNSHVLHLPERIFRGDSGIAELHILHILEDIFAVAFQPVDADMAAEHER